MGPPPPPLIALIVYTALYYDQAVGREGEVREHHLVSECNRDKAPLDISPPYVFSMLHISLQTDNDELFVFDALFYSLQCQMLSPCLV